MPSVAVTSSPMDEQNGEVSPTRTVGEATLSLPVGDNSRIETQRKDSPPSINGFGGVNIGPVDRSIKGHKDSKYTNGEVNSTGTPASPQSSADFHSTRGTEKSQSPPNPFIFPSTFQGSVTDAENRTSISAVFESSSRKQNNSTGSPPREPVIAKNEVQSKLDSDFRDRKQGDIGVVLDGDVDDLRPEVARLPGRKRVASWGEVQDETTPLAKEATSLANEAMPLANVNGLPPVKPKPSKDSMTTTGSHTSQQGHSKEHRINGNRCDNVRSSGLGESLNNTNTVMQNGVQLHSQLSDARSDTSSPSESRLSSVTKNRKSWDGVRRLDESEEKHKISQLDKQKDNKERSCSDSNLMVSRLRTVSLYPLPQVPLGSLARSSLAELILILSLTHVIRLPGQVTGKELLAV